MHLKTRLITLKNEVILIDLLWQQDDGEIFETKIFNYNNEPVNESITCNLGSECEFSGDIVDLRSP